MKILAFGLVAVLALPLLAQAQPTPDLHTPAAYLPADQTRFRAGAPGPAGLPAATGTYRLRPGVAVFGWLPAWVPLAYARQVDFTLLSHVAYDGYQATEAGALQAPTTGDAGPLAGLVHQANPRCRVLLSVGYHEPATGAALFGAAGADKRQALAQAVARQVSDLGADGVHLDLTFTARPAPAATPRPASKSEQEATKKRLKETRTDLNFRHKALTQKTQILQEIRNGFAQRQKQGKPIAPAELSRYASEQQQQRADSAQFIQERTQFRAEEAAFEKHLVLPAAGAGTDGRPAALQELVAALRQALPKATLTLGLPADDSSQVYAGLLAAGPGADLYVLQGFDYTAGRADKPGPLAPVQPSAAWGPRALATSVDYYLKQGVRPVQLLVGLASLGKVWRKHNPPSEMPAEGAPVRYWYATSRSLAAWPPRSRQLDAASGSQLLELPRPDSSQGPLLQVPYLAWADDTASLAARYEWVASRGLGGVGIWALGFDAPDAPLWACVRTRLAAPAAVAPDTAAKVAAATPTAPPAADSAKAGAKAAAAKPWVLTDTVVEAEQWVGSDLARVLLLGLVVLLAGVWVGLVVGAVRTARYWVPFGHRLAWMLTLLLGVAALLALYLSCVGPFERGTLWSAWLAALGLLLVLGVAYRRARPPYPLP